MYDFYYNYIIRKFKNPSHLFTDTDYLCYKIKTEDIYEDLNKDKKLFDNSDYNEKFKYFFKENKTQSKGGFWCIGLNGRTFTHNNKLAWRTIQT